MLTPEPPLDLSRDRTISVRPDSCRRLPHTIAGFEPPAFLGAHSRQRNQGCSHAETSSTSRNSYLAADTMPEAVRNWLRQNAFIHRLLRGCISWCGCLRALLLILIPIIGISPLCKECSKVLTRVVFHRSCKAAKKLCEAQKRKIQHHFIF